MISQEFKEKILKMNKKELSRLDTTLHIELNDAKSKLREIQELFNFVDEVTREAYAKDQFKNT